MPSLFTFPQQQAFDSDGEGLIGAKLWFYQSGTTTPQDTFIDVALSEPHSNPVVADAYGVFPTIWLDEGNADYRVTLTDQFDVAQYTVDGLLDQVTPTDILNDIKTVDGSGSGLDADLLDGKQGTLYALLADDETVTGEWNHSTGLKVLGLDAGFLDLPRNFYSFQHTLIYGDRGYMMDNSLGGWIIPEETGDVDHPGAFPNGSLFGCYNNSAINQQITAAVPATTTIRLAGTSSTGTRTVAPRGVAILWYRGAGLTTHEWVCWGVGVS